MNPNSAHQLWSRWITTVSMSFVPAHASNLFAVEIRDAVARTYRRWFGSGTEVKIDQTYLSAHGGWRMRTLIIVDCRTDGVPANDPIFRKKRMNEIAGFYRANLQKYGALNVNVSVKIEAGDAGTGDPPEQLILSPPLSI